MKVERIDVCQPGIDTEVQYTEWRFMCPACNRVHSFRTYASEEYKREYKEGTGRTLPLWEFNGNEQSPSFMPSLRIQSSRPSKDDPEKMEPYTVCHLVLTDGRINYCGDFQSPYANRSVPLPDLYPEK